MRLTFTNPLLLLLASAVILPGLFGISGCGRIVDKDRLRVAKIGDTYITRGDLYRILREMSDTDRPKINTKGDLLRLLNQQIDGRIKMPLGKQLKSEGKIDVSQDTARERFFQESGDEGEYLRNIWNMEIPANGAQTPLMKEFNLTADGLRIQKEGVEEGADAVLEKMLGEKAVEYLAVQAFKEKKITVSDEEIEREYKFAGDTLRTLEEINFIAIRFPAALPKAAEMAAEVRARIDKGETFETLINEYVLKSRQDNIGYVIESGIQNNPNLQRFKGFWATATGATVGSIVGPIYLPQYQQMAVGNDGKTQSMNMPDAYLVLKVLTYKPEHVLTVEEAKPILAGPLIIGKMMELLRKEKGVEVYEDQLPDPSQMGSGDMGV